MPAVNYEKKLRQVKSSIERSGGISGRDKEVLRKFERDLRAQDYSTARIHKLLNILKLIAREMEVPFEEADKEDIKELMAWVNGRDLSDATKADYRIVLKRFYRWLNGGEEHPKCVDWIKTTLEKKNNTLPRNMLIEEDIRKMTEAAKNPRDQALISLLWETGARIGELMDIQLGDIEDHRAGRQVIIDGKTGPRRIPLISSVPHLQAWLNVHPKGNENSAPLFVNVGNPNWGEPMEYRAVLKAIKSAAKEAEVDKPVNPHHFRHSRATYLASKFTEAQMCEWFGWVQGSDQPARYVHLSGRDIDSDYMLIHGMDDGEEVRQSELTPEKCPRCDAENNPGAKFCQKCGLALDERTAMKVEKKKTVGEMVMGKVEELSEKGTLDELIESAVEKKVKEILSEE